MTADWIKDQKGCRHWAASLSPGDVVTWSGGCKDGYAHGKGTAEWRRDGVLRSTYTGEMRGGRADGRGIFTRPDVGTYDGQWKDGQMHGEGRWASASGTTYEGAYASGKAHGEGRNTWSDGSHFRGEYMEGRRWTGIHYDAGQDQTMQIQLGRWKLTGRPAD